VQYPEELQPTFAFHKTDGTQWSAVSLVMALLGLGNKYSIGIRSNTLSCINAQQVIAGSAKTKRNTWVVHSCLRYESMDPGDLSDIQPASKRKGRGESLLTRQQYGALVGNDLRFLNVLKAMVGDVHQIPSDKDKCCVLMAIRATKCPNQPVRSFEPKVRFSHSPQPLVLLPAPRPRGRH